MSTITTLEASSSTQLDPEDRAHRPQSRAARLARTQYLRARLWPEWVAQQHGLEIVQHSGALWVRHPYPVPGSVGTYQDRRLPLSSSANPRWYAPQGRPLPLFGLQRLADTNARAVVLCEGAADAISAQYALSSYELDICALGIPGSSGWRSEWTQLLANRVVILATDADRAGRKLSTQLRSELLGTAAEILAIDTGATYTEEDSWLTGGDLSSCLAASAADDLQRPEERRLGPHRLASVLLEPVYRAGLEDALQLSEVLS